jgi:class 3 adenylate cyclase
MDLRFATGLHIGPAIYGTIGSPGRLGFAVVGPTVNTVGGLETRAKSAKSVAVCSREVAALLSGALSISEKAEAPTIGAVEFAIAQTTETALGIRLRAHDFRRRACSVPRRGHAASGPCRAAASGSPSHG